MSRQVQSTRMLIYTLIDSIMKKQRKGVSIKYCVDPPSIEEIGEIFCRGIHRINVKRERPAQSHACILHS